MTDATDPEWIWLAHEAIEEFKRWRIQAGATTASAASYATGARAFVEYCSRIEVAPIEAIESFHDHLKRSGDLSDGARSDYRSHARAFVRFLQSKSHSRPIGLQSGPTESVSTDQARPKTAANSPTSDDVASEPFVSAHASHELEATSWLDSFNLAPTVDLLAGYARTLEVLRSRGVIRTANAPAGDFAEWLVWRAFGGRIEPNSTKSHDVTDALGRRLQVKARLISPAPTAGQLQTSVFRSWDFDLAVLVQLAERDYSVVRAALLPGHVFEQGRANSRWSAHVKGWSVFMTPALLGHPDAVDVTSQLRAAAQQG